MIIYICVCTVHVYIYIYIFIYLFKKKKRRKNTVPELTKAQFLHDVLLALVDPCSISLWYLDTQLLDPLLKRPRGNIQVVAHEDGVERFVGAPHPWIFQFEARKNDHFPVGPQYQQKIGKKNIWKESMKFTEIKSFNLR